MTALVVRRHLKKKPINGYLLSVHGHAHLTHLVLWSALYCLLVSTRVSSASRLALAAKLLLQTVTKKLTLQYVTRRGFCEICSLNQ